jgi:hypothetical protein
MHVDIELSNSLALPKRQSSRPKYEGLVTLPTTTHPAEAGWHEFPYGSGDKDSQ